jgi:hypothetical protein
MITIMKILKKEEQEISNIEEMATPTTTATTNQVT